MSHDVMIISDARNDLTEVYNYILEMDGAAQAKELLAQLEQAIYSLQSLPDRGSPVPEMERIGKKGFRELHVKKYRIIYEREHNRVMVHCVLNSRRNILDILRQRLY